MLIKMVSALLMVTPFWWVSCGAAAAGLGADAGTDVASCADAGTAVSGAAGLRGVCSHARPCLNSREKYKTIRPMQRQLLQQAFYLHVSSRW